MFEICSDDCLPWTFLAWFAFFYCGKLWQQKWFDFRVLDLIGRFIPSCRVCTKGVVHESLEILNWKSKKLYTNTTTPAEVEMDTKIRDGKGGKLDWMRIFRAFDRGVGKYLHIRYIVFSLKYGIRSWVFWRSDYTEVDITMAMGRSLL